MTKQEVREVLEKQLQLLSEKSQTAGVHELTGLTTVMVSVSYRLREEDLQVADQ